MSGTYKGEAFRHHQQILSDDVVPRIILGKDGSFRERAVAEGFVAVKPTVGVVVQFTGAGVITGSRLVKFGKVSPKDIPSKEIWPDADKATVVFPEFDLSDFSDFTGQMSTPYGELPFKVVEEQGESQKVIPKGELESRGYSDLCFRLHFRTVDTETVKFTLVALPVNASMVVSSYGEGVGSRAFPGIRIHEGRGKLVTKEETESKFGIGLEPFYNLIDGKMDSDGQLIVKDIRVPASFDIKQAVVSLLQSGVTPNVHITRSKFEEAVGGKKYKKKEPKTCWPDPLAEDSKDTSDEEEGSKG